MLVVSWLAGCLMVVWWFFGCLLVVCLVVSLVVGCLLLVVSWLVGCLVFVGWVRVLMNGVAVG